MMPNTSAVWTAQSSCSMNLPLLWREMVKRHIRVPHSIYRASGAPFVATVTITWPISGRCPQS